MANANTIQLKGLYYRAEESVSTAVVITPGFLLEVASTDLVQAHSTEAGFSERAFAVEDALQGKVITDDYAVSTRVTYHLAMPGDEIQAFLKAGENVVIGDELISAGDGTLIKVGSEASGVTVEQIIGEAREALDLSASGTVKGRIDIRVH